MRGFCKCELSQDLTREQIIAAGDALRTVESSAAWFLICKKVQQLRESSMASKHPNQLTPADYAVAFGVETACDAFLRIFPEILEEAADARKRDDGE